MNKMKRIFIVIMMLINIYCSIESCDDEENPSQCQSHSIEISGLSCYTIEENNRKYCSPYYDKKNIQKIMQKYTIGETKELFSYREHYLDEGKKIFDIEKDLDNETIYVTEKDTYNKGETVKVVEYPAKDFFTSKDIKIIKNGNTCYNLIAQNYINLKLKSQNKSACHNVEIFDEHKDLMGCGFADYIITYKDKEYHYYNCFRIPDAKADSDFKQLFNDFYLSSFFQETIEEVLIEFTEEVGQYLNFKNSKKRKLQEQMDYDLTLVVEDKYGNIIKFDKDGKITDDPKKILLDSNHYNLNILLFLLGILLLL